MQDNLNDALLFTLLEHLLNGTEEFLKFNISLLKRDAIIKPDSVERLSKHFNNLTSLSAYIQAFTIAPNLMVIDWVRLRQEQLKKIHQLFYAYSAELFELIRKYDSGNYQVNYQVNYQSNRDEIIEDETEDETEDDDEDEK